MSAPKPKPGDALRAVMGQRDEAFRALEELVKRVTEEKMVWAVRCQCQCAACAVFDAEMMTIIDEFSE